MGDPCALHEQMAADIARLRDDTGQVYGLIREQTAAVAGLNARFTGLEASTEAGFKMLSMRFEISEDRFDRLEAMLSVRPQAVHAPPQVSSAQTVAPQVRRTRWPPKYIVALITGLLGGSAGLAAVIDSIKGGGK